jgi:mono/diheme cytochrome c family protein
MLQRLLVERMEHRIIVGTVAFLAIMVLVGWIAINEGARMQAFERQYTGRSIERGAALYATYCATCHMIDGLGAVGRAPALNSPYLFGHDFVAAQRAEMLTLQSELDNQTTPPTAERRAEIEARMAELDAEAQQVIQQMQPAINIGYDPEQPSRLGRLGWGATLNSFIYTTLVHGRPNSISYWPQAMPAWSQTAGGSLRGDQLEDLTAFILNWDKGDDWTIDDLNAVRQFPIYAVDPSTVTVSDEPRIGTDVAVIEAELANLTGDPVNGQALYNGAAYGCIGCHGNGAVAPVTEETWQAAQTVRLEDPANAGKTPEGYLIESIVNPNAYVVPPYPAGVMPQNFGERMTHQDLADILAYLESYTGEGATTSVVTEPSGS